MTQTPLHTPQQTRLPSSINFTDNDHIWLHTHPHSNADKSYPAALARRWKCPYRVNRRIGPLNHEFVREDTGEDLHIVNVAQFKLWFPTVEELDRKQLQKILEIFYKESDEEDFPGFATPDKN